MFFFLMTRRPPVSTRTDTLFPYTELFRSRLDRASYGSKLQDVGTTGAADSRDITLNISEPLFRLTTEGIRLHSNETLHHQTLSNLIDHRRSRTEKTGSHDTRPRQQNITSTQLQEHTSELQYLIHHTVAA